MAGSAFDVEQVRLAAARHLPASCHDDFLRLSRTLVHGPAFQWLLVDAPDENLRKQVMTALDDVLRAAGMSTSRLPLSDRIADVAVLEDRLVKNARASAVVHVIGRPGWFDEKRWDAFNVRRERLAAQARSRLVFWLDADAIALASRGAPDLWAWRGGVYAFLRTAPLDALNTSANDPVAIDARTRSLAPRPDGIDHRSMAERSRRIAEIRSWLASEHDATDELLVAPLDELGRLLYDLGDYDKALQHWRETELPLYRRLGDERAQAITHGQIADILQARGQFDEALRVRKEEQLPVYERLGDVRSRALTMGKIADILQARGQFDEALRIRKEDQLPIYERLGDARNVAITRAKLGMQMLDASVATEEARQLLESALFDLSRMGLPEAQLIADEMRKHGLEPPGP